MVFNSNFRIVEIAGEYMAVPVGKLSSDYHGVIALSESAAFLLKNLDTPKSRTEMKKILLDEYEVEEQIAEKDLEDIIEKFRELALIKEN